MHVAAFLRPILLSHLRVVLSHADQRLTSADSWESLSACVRERPVDVVVVDPGANGAIQVGPVIALRERYPSLPVTLYTVLSPVMMRAALQLSGHGVQHVVLHRFDDEPARFLGLLEAQLSHAVSDALLECLSRPLMSLTPPVARALERLYRRPDRYFTADDLAAAAGVTARTLYRQFEGAGLASPRVVVMSARVLRAYTLLRDPGIPIEEVSAKLGYSSPRMFARHMREAVGRTPREVRAAMNDKQFVAALVELLVDGWRSAAPAAGGAAPAAPAAGAPPRHAIAAAEVVLSIAPVVDADVATEGGRV